MDINPISMKKIYQSVMEQFITMIKDGKLKIGDKLPPERTLATMFNVSRASIREAFRAIEMIGLIEVRQGGGTYITGLNIANFINTISPLFLKNENMEKELLEFRSLLEIEAIKLAAEKPSDGKLHKLKESLTLMKKAMDKGDANLGAEADIQFHKAIFELTDNFILIKSGECISYLLEASVKFNREKILKNEQNSKELYNQHEALYCAVKENNPNIAVELMIKHLSFVVNIS